MNDVLRTYLLALCAAALLTALCCALLPEGAGKRVAALCCGFLMVLTVVRPITGVDRETLAQALSRTRMEAEQTRTGVEVKNRALVSEIIKQQAETYILDKAAALGIRADVEVTVEDSDVYPYPASVRICGSFTAEQRAALSRYLSEEFALGQEEQEWCSR